MSRGEVALWAAAAAVAACVAVASVKLESDSTRLGEAVRQIVVEGR